jgi:large subunit ribosomal protein L30e
VNKLLQKALRDEIEEDRCVLGARQVLGSVADSKLVVLSRSVPEPFAAKLDEATREHNIQTLRLSATSVALGKLCGLQFRVSAVSFNSLAENNIQSIINEHEGR